MRIKPLIILLALIFSAHAVEKPNVIIIFTDDMGYGDIAPFGSTINPTPELSRMAAEGQKLTDFYVSSSACTPSRASLMTGTYAERIGMGSSVVFPRDKRGLNPSEITVAEMLKEAGYTTGCFGKWHLGDAPEFMPLAQGFDIYEGIPYSNDMWVKGNKKRNFPPLAYISQNKAIAHVPDANSQIELTPAYTDAAIRFIENNQHRPFFAYIPHSAPHVPWFSNQVDPKALTGETTEADEKIAIYSGVIADIDRSVGRILQTLRDLKLDKKTLVIFTNDNGGFGKAQSGPLKGHKFGPKHEGHMRVATLSWLPGTIPPNSICSEIGTTVDILPSLAALCGGKVPTDRLIDGKDISALLLGQKDALSPHENHYYESDGLRQGKWKYVRYRNKSKIIEELYNLDNDLSEATNIAAQYPEKIQHMREVLDKHANDIKTNQRLAGFVESTQEILSQSAAEKLPTLYEMRQTKN
jgi:arylsulfatase A